MCLNRPPSWFYDFGMIWSWLVSVLLPVQRWGRGVNLALNILLYAGVTGVEISLASFAAEGWRWLRFLALLSVALLGISSWKQFSILHSPFTIEIEASSARDVGIEKSERQGRKFNIVTIPRMRLDTGNMNPAPQLEFRINFNNLTFTDTPMDSLLEEMPEKFPGYMHNPVVVDTEGGIYRRNLYFAGNTELFERDSVPAEVTLSFRDLRRDRNKWYEMTVPGGFVSEGMAKRRSVLDG